MAGYHLKNIPRGSVGELSKVQEEFYEFEDAMEQGCQVMALVELSDLVGAVVKYFETHHPETDINLRIEELNAKTGVGASYRGLQEFFQSNLLEENKDTAVSLEKLLYKIHLYVDYFNLGIKDLYKMSLITRRVFESGYRSSRTN